ncbi:zinc finger protein 596-like isoform X2 [Wyeomyia smithii]|uniref:zinc finger protein 596-like isoform X2 n=1 Tax=Wyeomyia smithii TaxID=174621 RepID=UPI002467E55A|nr:zinc finger protein 596-like isoform X2 [Wyeomyia smithii]
MSTVHTKNMSTFQYKYNLEMDLNTVCRICVSQSRERVYNIFSSAIVDGFLVTIPEIILYCVDLKIVQNDGIPCKICHICRETLLSFYIFKQRCKRTETLLQQTVASSDIGICKQINLVELKNEVTKFEFPHKFDESLIEYLDEASYEVTLDEASEINQHQIHNGIESLKNHLENYKDESPSLSVTKENLNEDDNSIEATTYLDMEKLDATDGRVLSKHSNEKEHIEKISPVTNKEHSVTICTICGKKITGKARYFRHVKLHEANANVAEFFIYHTCEICNMVFLKYNQLCDHIRSNEHSVSLTVDNKKPFICSLCSEQHHKLDDMKQHVLSHLKHFSCPFEGCGCEYASSARLANHIKNKKFLTSRSLAQHLKCLEKRHCCTKCGKLFAQPGELTLHLRVHNGDRPFQCTVCGKSYRTASFRTAHMDSHIEGKTFECHLCGKKLQSRTCYRNHVRRHSEEKKYVCDVCEKKFYTKYNVKVHKAKVHKINMIANAPKL